MTPQATLETPLRAAHETLGATLAEYFGGLVPERYVELQAECRTGRENVALYDAGCRAVLQFTGADRVRYLNAITTNNIRDLAEGQSNVGLLLNAQGHILTELTTLALADRLLVLVPALARQLAAETLEKYIIMDDVTLEDVTARYALVGVEGPAAEVLFLDACSVSLAQMSPGDHVEARIASLPCRLLRQSYFGEFGAQLIAERQHAEALWQALLAAVRSQHGGPIGWAAINALRLESRIPWFGYDFDDKVIPHEARLEESHISYTKGCYTGQEIVERVRSRGQVNRVRVSLQFLGRAVPEHGAKLLAAGKEIGYVTSATFSPLLGRVLGMGYVRREHGEPGMLVEWEGGEAEVL
jgi:folate-binding protein YgfZ